ncbi:MAG TPA: dephospho-CoA kinase [Ferrovibrio sp.]|uniref:dephospho-CoA kinase n=1 Tax=Ferrovibrio sp. TaxID=1917215 RepID=UPI002ECFE313
MLKIALTGSIGMGKSTVGKMLQAMGVPLFDADAAVHALYARGGAAVEPLRAAFPEAVIDGAVDRAILSRLVLGKPAEIRRLEAIVHPLVGQVRQDFLAKAEAQGAPFVVLDIPLLFEGRGRSGVDAVVVVSAPAHKQRQRVLSRPGMTEEKFAAILAQQVPDAEKRRQADFIIDTGGTLDYTKNQVRDLVAKLEAMAEGRR